MSLQDFNQRVNAFVASHSNDPLVRSFRLTLDPSEFDPTLRAARLGGQLLKLYDLSVRDPEVNGLLIKRKQAVSGRRVIVEPGGESAVDERAAEAVRSVVRYGKFDKMCESLLNATNYGIAAVELIWDRTREGLFLPVDWVEVSPERLRVANDGSVRILTVGNQQDGEPIDQRNLIVHKYEDGNNLYPYGRGVGSLLFWTVSFKRSVVDYWLAGAQRSGTPLGVVSSDGDRGDLKRAAMDTQSGGYLILPGGAKFNFAGGDSETRGDIFRRLVEYLDNQAQVLILGESGTTSLPDRSSRAAVQVTNSVRLETAKRDSDNLSETLNSQLVAAIMSYNYPNLRTAPKIVRDFEIYTTKTDVLSHLKSLRELGYEPENAERFLRESLGYAVVSAPPPAPAPAPSPQNFNEADARRLAAARIAEADKAAVDLDVISDEFANEVAAGGEAASFSQSALDAINNANNSEEALAALTNLAEQAPNPAAWIDTLSNALIVSELAGREDGQR